MRLAELIVDSLPGLDDQRPVTGLTADSRKAGPGTAYFALTGTRADGLAFARQAVAAGAVAVIGEAARPPDLPAEAAYLRVGDARRAFARAAARFFPRQPETVLAVTGTSGKTSVAEFTRQILAQCGRQAASLGTLGVVAPSGAAYGALTTPGPVELHEVLSRLAGEGVTHLAMEASSHGLDQRRLDGVRLTAGAFTALGRDHLDYHPSMEAYLAAKLRLFDTLLGEGMAAVINMDGEQAGAVAAVAERRGLRAITVGRSGRSLRIAGQTREPAGQRLTVEAEGRRFDIHLPLIGDFQASNALVAAGLALAGGADLSRIMAALGSLHGVPGRMETVGQVRGATVVVDYAHKPDALATVLDALRPYAARRLFCVVGCGGDRDRGKRPLMGAIAAAKADRVVVTDDNPRSEDPAAIRAEILAGAPGAIEIGDRAAAISAAVADLGEGDLLVVAGKGHETGQIVGDRVLPFCDRDAVLAAIAEVNS